MDELINNDEEKTRYGVLFVDDEPHILKAIRRMVTEEDLDAHFATSGRAGLEILRKEERIGLIVSDQRMPEMNGAEFLSQAKEIRPDAIRVILTGYADIEATIDAINKGGAHRYLSKPWNDLALLEAIRESLSFYALSRENQKLQEIIRQKNEELKDWNTQLKSKVLQQTATIREKNELLQQHVLRLKQNFRGTLTAFSSLLELRDRTMRNHAQKVTQVAAGIARSMALTPKQCDLIQIAAMLHDIGKIGVPDAILSMPEEMLEEEELTEYMRHSIRGQAAIDAIEELRPVGVLIRHHHEHFDGSGYPDHLEGDAIPLGARILAVADFVDSQIQKQQWSNPIDKVLELVEARLGSLFDPSLQPHLKQSITACYEKQFAEAGLKEQKINLHSLREGMILRDDLVSGTGLLLLSKGTMLNIRRIEHIMRNHALDPLPNEIVVLTRQ